MFSRVYPYFVFKIILVDGNYVNTVTISKWHLLMIFTEEDFNRLFPLSAMWYELSQKGQTNIFDVTVHNFTQLHEKEMFICNCLGCTEF